MASPAPAPAPAHVEPKPTKKAAPTSPIDRDALMGQIRDSAKPTLRALLDGACLLEINEERALIRLGDHEQLEFARLSTEPLSEIIRAETGHRVRIVFEAPSPTVGDGPQTEITPEIRKEAESNPLVRRAMDLFDARVVRVEDRRDAPAEESHAEESTTEDE